MSDKIIETFDDIEYYGQLWEDQKELDSRYTPPPPANKMRVPGAAFEPTKKARTAAIETEETVNTIISSQQKKNNSDGTQMKKQQESKSSLLHGASS